MNLQNAFQTARKAQESLYDGLCAISEYKKTMDEETKITTQGEVLVAENIPCRLSFSNAPAANGGTSATSINQIVKLFMAPEVTVRAGSKITVTQAGVTREYSASGVPAIYQTHQEIQLILFNGWA